MRWLVVACVGCNEIWGLAPTQHLRDDAAIDAPRPDGEPAGCPASYDHILQTTASRYRIGLSSSNWTTAAAACAADAPGLTHLIVLSNRNEWLELLPRTGEPPAWLFTDPTWVGASDRKSLDGTFKWVTAEDTGGFVVPAVKGAEPWEADQPDATGQCAAIRPSGSMHDKDCTSSGDYICECDAHPNVPANY